MKRTIIIATAIASAIVFASCTEESIGSTPMDSKAPGQVSDVQVKNVPGGADISYTLPDDEDLLYVKANYMLESGKEANVMVSMYADTLRIRGFASSKAHEVKIVTGDRSGNESQPVVTTITPGRSPIFDIIDGMKMRETFGGVNISWDNPTKSAIAVVLEKSVGGGNYEEVNTYYSDALKGNQSVRGMDAVEAEFRVHVRDRWDNLSDTVSKVLTPLYEEQLEAGTYKKYQMTGDSEIAYGWDLYYALNGNLTEPYGWFSKPIVDGGEWPARFTVEITGGVMLSRIRIIQRYPEMWENGNPKVFNVWGSNSPAVDGSYEGWTLMKKFTSVKPSGYGSGEYSDEDAYVAQNGEDFEFDADKLARYTYYRFEFLENWGGDNTFINLFEVIFYGNKGN